MLITLIILVVTVALMVNDKYRNDLVALGSLLALMLSGVLTPREALAGFSNPVIFVMAGMFVISGAIVRTGLAAMLSSRILRVAGKNTDVLFMLVMILSALIGSLVSNTGTVAIMMPIVVSMSMTIDESPSRFLMPLAFMSSIGGMFTILGNSSNMVVNDAYVKAGYPSLTLFSFFPVGVACFLFGVLVLAPVTSRYLSRRKHVRSETQAKRVSMHELAKKYRLAENMYLLEIERDSEAAGKPLKELCLPEKFGVIVSEIARSDSATGYFGLQHAGWFCPGPDTVVLAGDQLRVIGSITGIKEMAANAQFRVTAIDASSLRAHQNFSSVGICELVIMSSSRLVKRSVAESGLRQQFGVTVLGIQRGGDYLLENIRNEPIHAGDALLVHGSWDNLSRLEEYSPNWVVVGRPNEQAGAGRLGAKVPLVAAVIVFMLASMALNLLPTVVAVLLAAAILVVGCFKNMDDAYGIMNWESLVMLACLLPMATAMEKTGIVQHVSGGMVALCLRHGPHVALAVIYGICSCMNVVISTTPVSLLVAPIAVQVAQSLGYDPLPFLFAVATATSMCFASPFSTPSNALVMSAGRYTFLDYLKVGLPLQILMGAVMVVVLPLLYPFAPVG